MSTKQYLVCVFVFVCGVVLGSFTSKHTNRTVRNSLSASDATISMPQQSGRMTMNFDVVTSGSANKTPDFTKVHGDEWLIIISESPTQFSSYHLVAKK